MGRFDAEEVLFGQFRAAFPKVRSEFEAAIRELVYEYSTTNRENRFVVGGATEILLAAAMRASGIGSQDLGHGSDGADILATANALSRRFSVKASFVRGWGGVRLINFQGQGSVAAWADATIFVSPSANILFGSPDHPILADGLSHSGDALVLSGAALRRHAEANPDLIIRVDVPQNPRTGIRIASADVALGILTRAHYPLLGASLAKSFSPLEQVEKLVSLVERGALSQAEFAMMKQGILASADWATDGGIAAERL